MLMNFPLVKKLLQLWLLQKKKWRWKSDILVPQNASVFNVISQLYLIVMVDFG